MLSQRFHKNRMKLWNSSYRLNPQRTVKLFHLSSFVESSNAANCSNGLLCRSYLFCTISISST